MNAYCINILRLIKRSLSRFLAIVTIVMLGVAFFVGIRATGPDMKLTADQYYDKQNFMDIRILSTVGFNDDDIAAIQHVSDVTAVSPFYGIDVLSREGDNSLVIHLMSMELDAKNENDHPINTPLLMDGRMPQNENECVVDTRFFEKSNFKIGDTITLTSGDTSDITEKIKRTQYLIVGSVQSPLYISIERGSSTIGNGTVDSFIITSSSNFVLPVYTEAALTVRTDGTLSRFSDQYQTLLTTISDTLSDVGAARSDIRFAEIKQEYGAKLTDAKKELANAQKSLSDAEKKLDEAQSEIDRGETALQTNRAKFNAQISEAQKKLSAAGKELEDGRRQLDKKQADLATGEAQLTAARQQLADSKSQIRAGEAALEQLSSQISSLSAQLATLLPESPEYITLLTHIQTLQQTYDTESAKLDTAKKQSASGEAEIAEQTAILKEGKKALAQANSTLDKGNKELAANTQKLKDNTMTGEQGLADARNALDDAKQRLADGRAEYNQKKAEAQPDIDKGNAEIADAETQLAHLEPPKWHVLDINKNMAFADYKENSKRIESIGLIFPLIFFLVAALVSLTSMTRLVENDRTEIGTLKALGYGRIAIASKFVLFALLATIVGCGLGFAVGFTTFPRLIADAYGILYNLPPVLTPYHSDLGALSSIFAIFCTTVPTFLVCLAALYEQPAILMMPKAPPAGKRIFLEYIGILWKRMNFTQKVTARNLFRYKKRLLMTIIGVAGCTALLLTGFGLRDSVTAIAPQQFNEIRRYDMDINLKNQATKADANNLLKQLNSSDSIDSTILLHQQPVDVSSQSNTKTASLVVPGQIDLLPAFISLRNRTDLSPIAMTDDGVIITEKLAILLDVNVGDTITLMDLDHKQVSVKVTAYCENYIFHYIYMTPALYLQLYGTEPVGNQILGKLSDTSKDAENTLSFAILKEDYVGSVQFNTEIRKNFNTMLNALNFVVLVLILSAAALAFVVLFSLGGINIDERIRELATIKVLGFTNRETAAYVFRENVILAVMGDVLGLALGLLLHRFVILTSEVDLIMFGRSISPLSYALSFLLTILFAGMVNALMLIRLNKINMVESLKSIE